MDEYEDADVPPLEDLSGDLKRLGILRETPEQKKDESRPFGGFSRGFLTKSSGKTSRSSESEAESTAQPGSDTKETGEKSSATASQDDIPFIKKNPEAAEGSKVGQLLKQLTEAQERLLRERQAWLTEELFQNLQKDAALREIMSDPKFVELLKKYPDKPEEVLKHYKDLPELRRFLKKFCLLMGEHFTQLGEQQEKERAKSDGLPVAPEKTQEDIQRLHSSLAHPDVQEALADPTIKHLLAVLQECPGSFQTLYQPLDAESKRKVNILADAGILAFTSDPPPLKAPTS